MPCSSRAAARTWRCRSSAWTTSAGRKLQRIGLSATQKPIDEVARFLTSSSCQIVDKGHRRALDLAVEVPGSPLER
jgi:Lhr-like helicase